MAPPSPEVPLDDACTAIYNNTLYAYSKDAFQSLKIEDGAEWETLSMGVSVTDGVCVKATPGNDSNPDSLYIVGGTPNSTLTDSYSGLQRYDFSKAAWESIVYEGGKDVTQNRVYHSAVYLNDSALILVYAGSTDGSMSMSSQTFTVDTASSWAVSAYEAIAPPSVAPLLIPWSDSEAVLVGGTDTNTKVMIFSPSNSWVDSNSTLAEPLRNSSYVKGAIVAGDDGSKTLFTFDMTVSPNSVNRTILIDANSNPVSNSAAITARDLTLADWPSYNDTLAPTTTRTGYSIADDASGLVIGSGGNTVDTLCMFETKENNWLNATAELGSAPASQTVLGGNSATNTTNTTSAISASTSAADDQAISRAISMKILAAVLTSVLGLAAILLICLLLFRWRAKRKMFQEAGQARRASGIPVDDEKSGFNFDDKEPHSYTVPQQSRYRGHGHGQQDSVSSMAILMGRIGPGHQRGYDKENGSIASNSSSIFNQKYKNAISSPVLSSPTNNIIAKPTAAAPPRPPRGDKDASFVATADNPRPRGSTGPRRGSSRRSSGWNRYWSGGSAMNILGFGSKHTTVSSDRSSYSESRSNIVPPLQIPQAADLHLNRVHSNSPTVSHSNFTLREPSSATLERPISDASSEGDFYDRRDEFSSGVPSSINSWPPTQLDVPWGIGRSSNAYTESNYGTEVGGLPRKSEDQPPLPIQGNALEVQGQQRSVSQYTESNYGHEADGEQHPPLPIQGYQEDEGRRSDMSWLNLGVDKETK